MAYSVHRRWQDGSLPGMDADVHHTRVTEFGSMLTTTKSSSKHCRPRQTPRHLKLLADLSGIRKAAQESLRVNHAVICRHLRLASKSGPVFGSIGRERGCAVLTEEGLRFYARITAALNELTGRCR